jgi:hypothetical protein
MIALLSPVFRKFNCLAIVMLTLWLGGVGCALCCSTGVTELCCTGEQNTCNERTSAVNDCCSQAKTQSAASNTDSITQTPDPSCSLLPNHTPSLLSALSDKTFIAAVIQSYLFSPKLEIDVNTPVYVSSALPANRGSTYLRCCVLLI